jgi:hypothetical protein
MVGSKKSLTLVQPKAIGALKLILVIVTTGKVELSVTIHDAPLS